MQYSRGQFVNTLPRQGLMPEKADVTQATPKAQPSGDAVRNESAVLASSWPATVFGSQSELAHWVLRSQRAVFACATQLLQPT